MLRNRQTDDKLGPKQALTLCDIRHRTVLQVKSNPKNHAWQQELAAHQTSVLMILMKFYEYNLNNLSTSQFHLHARSTEN
jgi:hypothetical protein